MKLVYVAHKIRDPRGVYYMEQHIRKAAEVGIALWEMGFSVITPGLNTHLFDGRLPGRTWLEGDLEMLRRCDAVVMAPGYEDSLGALGERAEAIQYGIPVFYWPQDQKDLELLLRTPTRRETLQEAISISEAAISLIRRHCS